MTFAAPGFLWALLALPLVAALELWSVRRDHERTARLVARTLWARVVDRPAPAWRWIRLALLLLGTAGFVLALARPQWGIVREKIEREGVDVVLVLDTSGSMATQDVQPNRFFLARAALLSLVSRLAGDRFALVAFSGEAYPLVPLTLDADAIGLFLDTVEPGDVPAPGTSLGVGLAKGLDMFVDPGRNNKVMVLISDGEDLEGDIQAAVEKAKAAGVVIHTVGVGTANGAPVPDFDADGKQIGFKKEDDGSVHVSRLNAANLQAIARATGGIYVPLTSTDTSLWQIAAAIEGMEQKTLAREFSYRKKERFQIPLVAGMLLVALAAMLPPPRRRRRGRPAASSASRLGRAAGIVLAAATALAVPAQAQNAHIIDEALLRPQRLNAAGRELYTEGDHPKALESFSAAAAARPGDARLKFNLADAMYKNGKYAAAAAALTPLVNDATSPLAAAARFNLGNALYQQGQYPNAVAAYRAALELAPDDLDARRNLEMALRAIQEEKQRQQEQQKENDKKQDRKQNEEQQRQDQQQQQQKQQQQQQQQQQQRPKTEQEKEQERFEKDTGMSKQQAMQILDALQRAEQEQQKKQLAAQRAGMKKGHDW